MVPSPSKPRAAELVLQRMQQFKRVDPERLKHASAGCSLEATPEEDDPKGPREAVTAGNGMTESPVSPTRTGSHSGGGESGRILRTASLPGSGSLPGSPSAALQSLPRIEGPLVHFPLTFFDEIPLPLLGGILNLTFLSFLGPHPQHMEVPRPGVYLEL